MEVRNAVNMMNRLVGVSMNRPMARPGPYDRNERFGGSPGMIGPMRGGMRGRGNIKGVLRCMSIVQVVSHIVRSK